MTETMSIILEAAGFGIGLLLPFLAGWALDKIKEKRKITGEVL